MIGHLTFSNQSECFISALLYYSTLNMFMALAPGTGPIKVLQRKFYATQFFKHFD